MTFEEIERFYRDYYRVKNMLEEFCEEKSRNLGAIGSSEGSFVEDKVLKKIQYETHLVMVEKCLDQMTDDEKHFIGLRYFTGHKMDEVAKKMKWSDREVFRLRRSVLAKTAWYLKVQKYSA